MRRIIFASLLLLQDKPSVVPPPPPIDQTTILAKIGDCTLQTEAQARYIQTLIDKIKELEAAKPKP